MMATNRISGRAGGIICCELLCVAGLAAQGDGLFPSDLFRDTTTATQAIALAEGWNMISTFIRPSEVHLDTLCGTIIDNMVIIKNGGGEVYWPAQNINTIGTWDVRSGYQAYMLRGDTLKISGTVVVPESTSVSLSQGWNLCAYLRTAPMSIDSALAGISHAIVVVKNNRGEVFWPVFGINTIGMMNPGEGYQMYLNAPAVLTYPAGRPGRVNKR